MSSINPLSSGLIQAYITFQTSPDNLDAEKIKKMEEDMGMDSDSDATPKQKVDKYIVDKTTDASEEVKKQIEEMNKQQQKLLSQGQAGAASKFQAELDQNAEFADKQTQNESNYIDSLSKNDLTNVLKQVLSDSSGNSDDDNIDLVAQLTNMIAEIDSPTTVETKA